MENIYPNIKDYNQITVLKYKQELERQKIINLKK